MTTWRYLTGRPPKSLSCTSCNKMSHSLFCLLDRGEKPGHVIRSGAGSKGRTRECNDGCTGLSRAPAHVELTVPLVEDWSTSGGPSSHSALWPQDVISSQARYRPIWSSRYFWGIVMSFVWIPQSSQFWPRLAAQRIQRWLDRPQPDTGPCGAHGASGLTCSLLS